MERIVAIMVIRFPFRPNPTASRPETHTSALLVVRRTEVRPFSERQVALETLQQRHGQGLEDLAWSLVNKADFILNY